MPASYADLVVVDAFDGAQVPRSLVSGEFLDELARIGRNRRMVIYNVTDSAPFRWTRRLAAGLAERWRHLVTGTEHSVWKGRRFGNATPHGSPSPTAGPRDGSCEAGLGERSRSQMPMPRTRRCPPVASCVFPDGTM